MTKRLEDRIAVVTGSDSGIGRATAVEFAKEGCDVAVNYLHDREGAEETRRLVEGEGARAVVVQADLREDVHVARLIERTEEQLGTPFILVNNAAVGSHGVPLADLEVDAWENVLRSNLTNPFHCCRHFVRARKRVGGRGKILNVSSIHETIPSPGGAAYDVSKGGLRNLTRTLALEVAPERINVNGIAPGMVLTPFNQAAVDDAQARQEQVQRIPWKRAAEPWEVGRLAVYLASDDADYVTGQSFTIDGGLMLNTGQGA